MRRILFVLFSAAALVLPAFAQEQVPEAYPAGTVRIRLLDGTTLVGMLTSETDTTLVLLSESGVQTTIPRAQVSSLVSMDGKRFFRVDPNRSRLLFGPTGRALSKGTGYVADYELFMPFVGYGAGGGITLAGGISILPFASGQFLYAAPKVTVYERDETSVAWGLLASTFVGEGIDDFPVFGLVYGVTTFGGSTAWLTTGLGFGFADGEFGKNPAFMIGAEVQFANSAKLVSENYFIVGIEDATVLSGGIRFFGDRLSTDLALLVFPALVSEGNGWPFFPWLGFAYNFGD